MLPPQPLFATHSGPQHTLFTALADGGAWLRRPKGNHARPGALIWPAGLLLRPWIRMPPRLVQEEVRV